MSLVLRARSFDDPDAQTLIAQLQALYVDLYGNIDRDRTDPAEFAPPNGLFVVGSVDGTPVACGGWRLLDARTAEIKRMFVVPAARGLGYAQRLLAELELTATASGVRTMTLNTGYRQPDAIAFYLAQGYRASQRRFGHYEQVAGASFYEKPLAG